MDPSLPQDLWIPFYTFQKSVGSMEPTEPTLTTPLAYWAVLIESMSTNSKKFLHLFCLQAEVWLD